MMEKESAHFSEPPRIIFAQESIIIYQGLDKSICQAVISRFNEDENKRLGKIGRSEQIIHEQHTKFSWDLEIHNQGAWQDIFQEIHPGINRCIAHYLSQSPVLKAFRLQATGYKIQMYPKNQGHFSWHADSVGKAARDRVVAMVLYLNDVEHGGETGFFHQNLKVAPRAGQLMLFPTGWNYMHCGHIPISDDKYIISTFIRIND